MSKADSQQYAGKGVSSAPRKFLRFFFGFMRLIASVLILVSSIYLAYHWISNPPKTQRQQVHAEATLVEVSDVHVGQEQVFVDAMGTVIPAHETRLAAQVAGKILRVSPDFIPGGVLRAGDTIVEIESEDYQIAVKQQESNLARAEASLKLEMGQQAVAQQEYELIGKTASKEDEELLLRKPQLASAKASVDGAIATLEKARLDLSRTTIRAPYNCVIQTRLADLGGYVSPGTALATIVGTDKFWVETSVGVDELKWLDIPQQEGEKGSAALIFNEAAWGPEIYKEGYIVRLLPELDEGRMARVIVAVSDPLGLNESSNGSLPLILKSFVRVRLLGKTLSNVAKLPRKALREGTLVWVMTADNQLEFRPVSIVWSDKDFVYVAEGLQEGERVVISNLTAPVPGMKLRTKDENLKGSVDSSNEDNQKVR